MLGGSRRETLWSDGCITRSCSGCWRWRQASSWAWRGTDGGSGGGGTVDPAPRRLTPSLLNTTAHIGRARAAAGGRHSSGGRFLKRTITSSELSSAACFSGRPSEEHDSGCDLRPRAATRDPVLASGKFGPIPTFPPHSHVRSYRIPTSWSCWELSRTGSGKVRRSDDLRNDGDASRLGKRARATCLDQLDLEAEHV